MKNAKLFMACCVGGILAGCGGYNSDQISTAGNESGEAPNSGSATDVVPGHGTVTSTNHLNAADIGIGGTPQRQSGNYQSQSLPGQGSDEELAKQIRVALTTGSMGTTGAIAEDQLTRIQVRAQNGVVELTGPVSSEAEKRVIERQVAGMKGVKSVRNELSVGARTVEDKPIQSIVPRTSGNH